MGRKNAVLPILITMMLAAIVCREPASASDYDATGLESVLERISRESAETPLLDEIGFLVASPILIEEAAPEEPARIPGITYIDAARIISYVKSNPAATYQKLCDDLALTPDQSYLLGQCTCTNASRSSGPNNGHRAGDYGIDYRLRLLPANPGAGGFADSSMLGAPLGVANRLSLRYGDYSMNLLANRSAGEGSLTEFLSGSLSGAIEGTSFIVGDFNLESGMGSILWKTFGMRKGADVIAPALQFASKADPYRSTMNFGYFRGISITQDIDIGGTTLRACAWSASTPRSGSIDSATWTITSINSPIYFRTANEIIKKNNLTERSGGGMLEWKSPNIRLGATALYLGYDHPVESSSQTAFSGKAGILASIYSLITLPTATVAAELARDALNHISFRAGAQTGGKKIDAAVAFRYFPAGFRSPFGYSFGESSSAANEAGFYCGLRWKATPHLRLSAFVDIYRSLSATYYVPLPVRGMEIFSEGVYAIDKNTDLTLRLDYENKTDAIAGANGAKSVFQRSDAGCRAQIGRSVNANFRFNARAEFTAVNYDGTQPAALGVMTYGELEYHTNGVPGLKAGARIAYFDAPSYESAVWEYEPRLTGMISSAALYGSGVKSMIWTRLEYDLITIEAFYSRIFKNNIDELGTYPFNVEGNTGYDAGFQLALHI